MQIALPLDKMTTKEKLQVMEDVWDNLCHTDVELPSPSWHEDVLREREESVRNGSAEFLDLHVAKQRLRDRIS